MEYCHAKREGTDLRACWLCKRPANLFCKLSRQEFHDLFVREGGSSHHEIMITQRQGGRVTLVLLTLKGASFDHHENHLRPQYNLSVFCHMNKKHVGLGLRMFTQTQMAQDVHCVNI